LQGVFVLGLEEIEDGGNNIDLMVREQDRDSSGGLEELTYEFRREDSIANLYRIANESGISNERVWHFCHARSPGVVGLKLYQKVACDHGQRGTSETLS
jgi:hypothetical protein